MGCRKKKMTFFFTLSSDFYQCNKKQSSQLRMKRPRKLEGGGSVDTMNSQNTWNIEVTEYLDNRLMCFCMHLLNEYTFVSAHLIAWVYLGGVELKKISQRTSPSWTLISQSINCRHRSLGFSSAYFNNTRNGSFF